MNILKCRNFLKSAIKTALTLFLLFLIQGNLQAQRNDFQFKSCNTNFQFGDTCVENLVRPYFENYRLILCGEIHYYENNWLVKSTLIKTLNSLYGVTRMFIEYPISYQDLYNDYLLYGDEYVLRNMKYLTQDTLNEKLFLEDIRNYNLTRPDSLKVRVICVDMEKNALIAFWQLRLLLDGISKKRVRKTKKLLQDYVSMGSLSDSEAVAATRQVIDDFRRHQRVFRKQMTVSNFNRYKKIIDGLELGYMYKYTIDSVCDNRHSFERREKFLRTNLSDVLSEYPNQKFFGSFGLAHCILTDGPMPFWGVYHTPLAFELNTQQSSPVKGNICSIVQYYENYNDSLYLHTFLGTYTNQFTVPVNSPFSLFNTCTSDTSCSDLNKSGQLLIVNRNPLGPFAY